MAIAIYASARMKKIPRPARMGPVGTKLWCKVGDRKHVRHPSHEGASQHPFRVLTDRIGFYVDAEFLSVFIMPVHREWHGQGDSLGTAAFFTAKVQ